VNVVIFGATGLIGHGAVGACLADPGVESVLVVGRRPTGRTHPKLREVQHTDFSDLSAIEGELGALDLCLWSLGISAAGVDEQAYRRVIVDFPVAAAETLHRLNPSLRFVYVSGAGTKRDSKTMWSRVKAEAEDALDAMPLEAALSIRPAGVFPVDGARSSTRSYRIMYAIFGPLLPLWRLLFRKYVVTSVELGQAMLALARSERSRGQLESPELVELVPPKSGS
jgi:uncharacterized protein YbjT (DUF2867 family)